VDSEQPPIEAGEAAPNAEQIPDDWQLDESPQLLASEDSEPPADFDLVEAVLETEDLTPFIDDDPVIQAVDTQPAASPLPSPPATQSVKQRGKLNQPTQSKPAAKAGAISKSAGGAKAPARSGTGPTASTSRPVSREQPASRISATPAPESATAAPAKPSVPQRVELLPEPLPAVDQTQTVRALTSLELADEEPSQAFVIQLSVFDGDFRPGDVPNLSIFKEYQLYLSMGYEDSHVIQALRLGFFSEQTSAEMVAGYLKGFFEAPTVKRVSIAERERFSKRRAA
jgi:hypothetical protein